MKKIILNIICLSLFAAAGFTQNKKSDSRDKYDNMAFAGFSKKADAESEEDDAVKAVKFGNSFELNGNSESAAIWYKKATEKGADAMASLKYAKALLESGDCSNAIAWHGKFMSKATADEKGNRSFISDCGDFQEQPIFGPVEVQPVAGVNSAFLDFAPIPMDGGIVFTSSRKKYGMIRHNDKWTDSDFTDLYFLKKGEEGNGQTKRFYGKINRKHHDGTAVFVGDKMFFTRNNLRGEGAHEIIDLKIYQAIKTGDKWNDAAELPFNSDDFATCHPAVTADGKTMIFSSNRPGGQGGMDLWKSTFDGSTWSAPTNLGADINSSDNEIFPFLDSKNRLFYSSDGWAGLGGLDLFVAENDGGAYGGKVNLGTGLNSNKDDFGIYVSPEGDSGYISSNRTGGMGGDDIYEWTAPNVPIEIEVMIVDAETQEPIETAMVKVNEMEAGSTDAINNFKRSSASDGLIDFKGAKARSYAFDVEKAGYEPASETVAVEKLDMEDGVYKIPMNRIKEVAMDGIVVDARTGDKIPGAAVEMKNLCDNTSKNITADANGKFDFVASVDCDYEIIANKTGYLVGSKTVTKSYTPGKIEIPLAVVPAPSIAVITTRDGVPKGGYSAGQIIVIRDIYYDFDKHYIRNPDASKDLAHLISVMQQFPSMTVELGSHTDSRGSDEYNRNLSQNRAEAAVKYIVSQGIGKDRITARGYGETTLTNRCANGVPCSKAEHQANRRTEVRVLSIRGGVEVRDEH